MTNFYDDSVGGLSFEEVNPDLFLRLFDDRVHPPKQTFQVATSDRGILCDRRGEPLQFEVTGLRKIIVDGKEKWETTFRRVR